MTTSFAAALAISALTVGFAAGSAYSTARTERAQAQGVVLDYNGSSPIEYFPARYENQARDVEALPAQF